MAVYTEVSFEQVDTFVQTLGLGPLRDLRPILAGIENTNYFVDTRNGEWVLTLFERLSADELPFYLRLMQHLARCGVPAPRPQAGADGGLLHHLAGKPAAVLTRLPGRSAMQPQAAHLAQVGAMLAKLHLAAADYPNPQEHPRGLTWWIDTVPRVLPFVDGPRAALLRDELAFQCSLGSSNAALPRGVIHADLFRDNAVFETAGGETRLSGVFDFFFAGVDSWLFDIAVCLNDWCTEAASGGLIEEQAAVFVTAYDQLRPLQTAERQALPAMLRAAAFRFWLSRLWDLYLPRDATLLRAHDPAQFERVLRQRRQQPWLPPH